MIVLYLETMYLTLSSVINSETALFTIWFDLNFEFEAPRTNLVLVLPLVYIFVEWNLLRHMFLDCKFDQPKHHCT
jgi:hypothetical protein